VSTANNVIAIGISAENVTNSCYIGQIYSNVQPQVGTDRDLMTITATADLAERTLRHADTNAYPANTQSQRSDLCTQAGKLPLP
jgi:hypothetical protein